MKWRLHIFLWRFIDYVKSIPQRLRRFFVWLLWLKPLPGSHKAVRWFIGGILLLIDITPIPVVLEALVDLFKWKTRGLNEWEKQILAGVFGHQFPFRLVGIDPASVIARIRKIAFVSFQTINIHEVINFPNLIHETVHIWQYRKYGSAYISEAIWAQNWGGGYNYGGCEALRKFQNAGLAAFNLEQQADIIEDYFRLKNGLPMQWSKDEEGLEELLKKYVDELRGF
jgi:hypothetical protein